jgi:hypothetical protein
MTRSAASVEVRPRRRISWLSALTIASVLSRWRLPTRNSRLLLPPRDVGALAESARGDGAQLPPPPPPPAHGEARPLPPATAVAAVAAARTGRGEGARALSRRGSRGASVARSEDAGDSAPAPAGLLWSLPMELLAPLPSSSGVDGCVSWWAAGRAGRWRHVPGCCFQAGLNMRFEPESRWWGPQALPLRPPPGAHLGQCLENCHLPRQLVLQRRRHGVDEPQQRLADVAKVAGGALREVEPAKRRVVGAQQGHHHDRHDGGAARAEHVARGRRVVLEVGQRVAHKARLLERHLAGGGGGAGRGERRHRGFCERRAALVGWRPRGCTQSLARCCPSARAPRRPAGCCRGTAPARSRPARRPRRRQTAT